MYWAMKVLPLGLGVNYSVSVKIGPQHLLLPAGMHMRLYWTRLALLDPLLGLIFGYRRVEGNCQLAHHHNTVLRGTAWDHRLTSLM